MGALVSSVWSGDTSNPYGGLTFTYQLSNDPSSISDIGIFRLGNYFNTKTDLGYNGMGVIPLAAGRYNESTDITLINFTFGSNYPSDPWLKPGLSTPTFVIQTDSQVWDIGRASLSGGFGFGNVTTFAPSAVPEPATLGLAISSLVVFANRKRF